MLKSLVIFGGIGSIVETEQQQFDAFNASFRALGIDAVWSRSDYIETLSSSGGKARLGKVRTTAGQPLTSEEIDAVHTEKTRIFDVAIVSTGLALRDGVASILRLAANRVVTLAWATTTSRDNVDAIFSAAGNALPREAFAWIGDASKVVRQKPDPEVYLAILRDVGFDSACALAIEDSPTGVMTSRAAGIFTVAFPGALTADKDYRSADRVVSSLDEIHSFLAA